MSGRRAVRSAPGVGDANRTAASGHTRYSSPATLHTTRVPSSHQTGPSPKGVAPTILAFILASPSRR